MRFFVGIGLASCVLLSSAALAADGSSFTAMGTGKAIAKPDIVFVDISFTSDGKTPELAIKADADTVGKVTEAFTKAGVESRDLQTANYVIDEVEGPDGCGQYRDNQKFVPCAVVGYEIRNSLTLRIRDLSKYGNVLSAAIDAGLKNISRITLDVSDAKPFQDEAYQQASWPPKQRRN